MRRRKKHRSKISTYFFLLKDLISSFKKFFHNFIAVFSYYLNTIKKILPFLKSRNKKEHFMYFFSLGMIGSSIYITTYVPYLTSNFYNLPDGSDPKRDEFQDLMLLVAYSVFSYKFVFSMRETILGLISPFFKRASRKISLSFLNKLYSSDQDLFTGHTADEILEKLSRISPSLNSLSWLTIHGLPVLLDFVLASYRVIQKSDRTLFFNIAMFFTLYGLLTYYQKNKQALLEKNELNASKDQNHLLREAIYEHYDIKPLLGNEIFLNRVNDALKKFEWAANAKERHNNNSMMKESFLAITTMLFFRLYGYRNYAAPELKLLDALLVQVIFSIDALIANFQSFRVCTKDIHNFLKIDKELSVKPDVKQNNEILSSNDFTVSVSRLSFFKTDKDNRTKILNGVTFDFSSNQVTAIVGTTGAGKTTLINLLLRKYPYESGSISISGENIQEIDLETYKQFISVAPQKPKIFDDSLEFNITCGAPIDKTKLLDIIKLCALEKFINQQDPSQVKVGKGGIELSGGERQLIGLARLLAKEPRVIIYDEAIENLDPSSRTKSIEVIRKLNQERAVIWITHNYQQLKEIGADRILRLKEGKIEEISYETLLETDSKKTFRH